MNKKQNYKILFISIVPILALIGIYKLININMNNNNNKKCECDCDKEGFSLLQSLQSRTQMPRTNILTSQKNALKNSLKETLKNNKKNINGFKNYVDVNYYYDKMINVLS